jgi:hypothetical protein
MLFLMRILRTPAGVSPYSSRNLLRDHGKFAPGDQFAALRGFGAGACAPAYRSVARFARAGTGTLGTSNSTDTRRDPHSGHISRLSRRERGKFGPRVQTNVCMSSGAR